MQRLSRWLTLWQWGFLLLLSPLFLFPSGARGLVLFVIPLFWLARKLAYGKLFAKSPFDLAIICLLIMTGLSAFVSFDIALSLPKIVGVLFGIAIFYAVLDFSRFLTPWPVVSAYLAGGFLLALIGLVGTDWSPPFEFLNRIHSWPPVNSIAIPGAVGGVINQNELAGALAWIAPLALACLLGLGRRLWDRKKLVFSFVLLVCLLTSFAMIATTSRGGILALCVGAGVVVAFFIPSRWRVVLGVGLVTALLVAAAFDMGSLDRDIMGDSLGLSGRIEIWSRALLAIGDFPLTGIGFNGFRQIVRVLYPLFTIPADIDLAHAHNHLLQVALDTGLPGLIAYVSIWLISAGLLWEARIKLVRRGLTEHSNYSLIAGLAGSLAGGWMFGLFDAVALGSRPSFLWWMLIGLTGAVYYSVVFPMFRHEAERPVPLVESPVEERPIIPPPIIPTATSRYSKQ